MRYATQFNNRVSPPGYSGTPSATKDNERPNDNKRQVMPTSGHFG